MPKVTSSAVTSISLSRPASACSSTDPSPMSTVTGVSGPMPSTAMMRSLM
jgi:hypothetical protein